MKQTDYLGLWYKLLNMSYKHVDFYPQVYYSNIEIINEFLDEDYDWNELHQMACQIRMQSPDHWSLIQRRNQGQGYVSKPRYYRGNGRNT